MKTQNTNSSFIPKAVALASSLNTNDSKTSWLNNYRQAQTTVLENSVFPHKQVEHFKYNRLHGFESNDFNAIATAETDDFDLTKYDIAELNSRSTNLARIVFINGIFASELSNIKLSTHKITTVADADETQQAKILDMLTKQDISKNVFTTYNASLTAVNNNAVLIEVGVEIDENSPADIIEVISVIDETSSQKSANSQLFVDIADRCKVTIIQRTLTADNSMTTTPSTLSTQRTIINIGDSATCTHYNLALEATNSLHFGSICYNLLSHSTLNAFHTATGSQLKKIDVDANHLGQHAHANIDGLYIASDDEQVDYHTTVTHPFANGTTNENFRGIVNHKAEATFNGRIHIYEDAQKTLAELSNKNLLLSDNAILHTKPELEIYADDVVCAHGATVSRLNNDSLSYLQARGISKAEGEKMLSYAFFDELLAELDYQAVADYLRPILFAKFG